MVLPGGFLVWSLNQKRPRKGTVYRKRSPTFGSPPTPPFLPKAAALPTLAQLHRMHLERDIVLLGEDINGATGLRQQIQVQFKDHGVSGGNHFRN